MKFCSPQEIRRNPYHDAIRAPILSTRNCRTLSISVYSLTSFARTKFLKPMNHSEKEGKTEIGTLATTVCKTKYTNLFFDNATPRSCYARIYFLDLEIRGVDFSSIPWQRLDRLGIRLVNEGEFSRPLSFTLPDIFGFSVFGCLMSLLSSAVVLLLGVCLTYTLGS